MSAVPQPNSLFHLVGVGVAASQIFETIFVVAARLVLKQPNIQTLEDLEPISNSTSFKQPVKALLNELSQSQSIDSVLETRLSRLIEDRHRMIHRSFREFGWPAAMSPERERELSQLCARVVSESDAMSIVFTDIVLN